MYTWVPLEKAFHAVLKSEQELAQKAVHPRRRSRSFLPFNVCDSVPATWNENPPCPHVLGLTRLLPAQKLLKSPSSAKVPTEPRQASRVICSPGSAPLWRGDLIFPTHPALYCHS